MEDYYQHKKQYCKPGESESDIALGIVITLFLVILFVFGILVGIAFL